MRIHRLTTIAGAACALAVAAPAAPAAAPGWSTPHTASAVTTGTYAAAPNGQGVQLFANGGVPQRTGQLRAIKTDATQGTAVGVNAGGAGFDLFNLDINDNARLVAAWTKDLENAQPVPVAVAFGTRTSLPRTATVFSTGGLVSDLASAVADNGIAVVAWVQSPLGPNTTIASPTTIVAATLRSGQSPIVTTLGTRTGALINNLAVGFDSNAKAIVTWNVTQNENGGPGILAAARGTGTGTFAPAVDTTVDPTQQLLDLVTFVTGDGGLLLFWTNGGQGAPTAIRYSQATGGGVFTAPRTLISGNGLGLPSFAANSAGRAAVLVPIATGGGTSLSALLRTPSGTWGAARLVGPSGARTIRRVSVGVDGRGRVVVLWDDAGASSSTPTRILAARSSSSSNPLNTYNQLSQRSGDRRCQTPALALSSSGDGLGSWLCSTASSGSIAGPRLARLTAPS